MDLQVDTYVTRFMENIGGGIHDEKCRLNPDREKVFEDIDNFALIEVMLRAPEEINDIFQTNQFTSNCVIHYQHITKIAHGGVDLSSRKRKDCENKHAPHKIQKEFDVENLMMEQIPIEVDKSYYADFVAQKHTKHGEGWYYKVVGVYTNGKRWTKEIVEKIKQVIEPGEKYLIIGDFNIYNALDTGSTDCYDFVKKEPPYYEYQKFLDKTGGKQFNKVYNDQSGRLLKLVFSNICSLKWLSTNAASFMNKKKKLSEHPPLKIKVFYYMDAFNNNV